MTDDLSHGGRDVERALPRADSYAITPDCTREEFLAVVRVYARAVVDAFDLHVDVDDLTWEVSTRARRRAGALEHRDDEPRTIKLAWRQFETAGWSATAETVRHELLHAHLINEESDSSHGEAFRSLAKELETGVHCDRFAKPKWWIRCVDCGARLARYRRSKLVSNPEQYQCGECGGTLRVERNESTDTA